MSSDASDKKPIRGQCLCGDIAYELDDERPFTFVLCHCINCRKVSGSAFMANAFFKPESVRIVRGKDKVKEYHDSNTTSGRTLIRSFCPRCGSCLFTYSATGRFTIIPTGTVDSKVDWVPRRENREDCRQIYVRELMFQTKGKL
ncbi:hypothetical protein AX16_005911 [Volvariella volvacea WC 439]|nr:hypothetical protein AX16_005911 [Volvariella volvacea WC 439]